MSIKDKFRNLVGSEFVDTIEGMGIYFADDGIEIFDPKEQKVTARFDYESMEEK